MDEEIRKQMSSTNKKGTFELIQKKYSMFVSCNTNNMIHTTNVHYQLNLDMKPQFSPFQVKDNIYEPATRIPNNNSEKVSKKTA